MENTSSGNDVKKKNKIYKSLINELNKERKLLVPCPWLTHFEAIIYV